MILSWGAIILFVLISLYILWRTIPEFGTTLKSLAYQSVRGRVNWPLQVTTYTFVLTISIMGLVFYKFSVAFLALLLSDDLTSFFSLARGIYTWKSGQANSLTIMFLFTGLFLIPILQMLTFYLIHRSIRHFMRSMNRLYGQVQDHVYTERDVIYAGLTSAGVLVMFEVVLYAQRVEIITALTNLLYIAISKSVFICYFIAIAHVHLLRNKKYKETVPAFLGLNLSQSAILNNEFKTLLITCLIGGIFQIPAITGTQFMSNNVIVLGVCLAYLVAFILFVRLFLSKWSNYLGVIMLTQSPIGLAPNYHLLGIRGKRLGFAMVIGLVVLSAIFKIPAFAVFFVFLLSGIIAFYLALILGYTLCLLVIWIIYKVKQSNVPGLHRFVNWRDYSTNLLWNGTNGLVAAMPMIFVVYFTFAAFTYFPKQYRLSSKNHVVSVLDEDGFPLLINRDTGNNCVPVSYNSIPPFLLKCLYAREDKHFERQNSLLPNHTNWHGISFSAIRRLPSGGGGSNITNQLIKNSVFETFHPRDIQRKVVEILASYQLSIQNTPKDIVTKYLNTVSMNGGRGHSGVMMASLETFGRPVKKINYLEQLYLVWTLKGGSGVKIPTDIVPWCEGARYKHELKNLLIHYAEGWAAEGLISENELTELKRCELDFVGRKFYPTCELGTKVFLNKEISESEVGHSTFQSSISVKNQKKVIDVLGRFESAMPHALGGYQLFSAAIIVDVHSGSVIGHYGGRSTSDLCRFGNGCPMASTIKPFVLLEVLEHAIKYEDVRLFDGSIDGRFAPKNSRHKHKNKDVGIDEILGESLNAPLVNLRELVDPIMTFQAVENKFSLMGIQTDRGIKLGDPQKRTWNETNYPLGSRRMTVFDIAQVYQPLFNEGLYRQLTCFDSVYNAEQNHVKRYPQRELQVYNSEYANQIKKALNGAMKSPNGTARDLVPLLPRNKRFYAKTGTSEGGIHGYMVLSDGDKLVVAYTTYGKVEPVLNSSGEVLFERLELNRTPEIPHHYGAASAGILAAMLYSAFDE